MDPPSPISNVSSHSSQQPSIQLPVDVSGTRVPDISGTQLPDVSGTRVPVDLPGVFGNTIIRVPSDVSLCDVLPHVEPIVNITSNITVNGTGYQVIQNSGTDISGIHIDRTTFDTTQPELYDPQIHQILSQTVGVYNDQTDSSQSTVLLNQIKAYAQEIECSDFHGKGTIDDYTVLFEAAGRIANESRHMELDIEIDGFNQFAQAADELSDLFSGFILKLQSVNIISDITFLTSISIALGKIVNLSNIFGRFKQTIFDTSVIQFPKSAHDTKLVISDVMGEVNCAMHYINYFVSPTETGLVNAELSVEEKNIISKSVDTINHWNILCENGISIAMANNPDVQYIKSANEQLKLSTVVLKNNVFNLKRKLAAYNIVC
jgi:hypothetical protein